MRNSFKGVASNLDSFELFQPTPSDFSRRRHVFKFHWSNKELFLLNSALVLEVYLLQRSLFTGCFEFSFICLFSCKLASIRLD